MPRDKVDADISVRMKQRLDRREEKKKFRQSRLLLQTNEFLKIMIQGADFFKISVSQEIIMTQTRSCVN